MFDVGFWEISLVAVIGLIVLGPERLPVVARTLGGLVGRAKGYVRGLTSELEREISVDDLRSEVRRAREQIESSTRDTIDAVREPATRETADQADESAQKISDSTAAPAAEQAAEQAAVDARTGATSRPGSAADNTPQDNDARE